ncbi:hypothetical protein AXG93_1598s1010 [Marchantia polymorpha subsp. ruderalis]|uniref:Transmembrane protein n=1 Tax=Marchantia polymorpha subsp. ruderalis TaxID=1480154 RepID=A0A176W2D4_MARPO|nr:hypothetical protein AXG93_1598s1010 [Marchantia polymorpha subsp. ruderalis]
MNNSRMRIQTPQYIVKYVTLVALCVVSVLVGSDLYHYAAFWYLSVITDDARGFRKKVAQSVAKPRFRPDNFGGMGRDGNENSRCRDEWPLEWRPLAVTMEGTYEEREEQGGNTEKMTVDLLGRLEKSKQAYEVAVQRLERLITTTERREKMHVEALAKVKAQRAEEVCIAE